MLLRPTAPHVPALCAVSLDTGSAPPSVFCLHARVSATECADTTADTHGQGMPTWAPPTTPVGPMAPTTLQAFDLFPTRIWQADLPGSADQTEEWAAATHRMRDASPEPAGRTNRFGWNSKDMAVLDQPVFSALRDFIRVCCSLALSEMGAPDIPFELQSWVNLHERGGFNYLHVHEGSLLSGSFYLKVPQGSGRLVFRDPRPGVIHGYVKGTVPNGHRDIHLTPHEGLAVFFPCWMEHYVEPHDSDDPRIVIAFNAIGRT